MIKIQKKIKLLKSQKKDTGVCRAGINSAAVGSQRSEIRNQKTAYCQLSTANCQLPTANCNLEL
jgi:hypothetical protein